jgi:putative hydrolase of the HAD superfamily
MIQAVVFDFGNVLCRLDRLACNTALSAHTPYTPSEVSDRLWGGELENDAETGRYDSHEYFRRIQKALRADSSWDYETFADEYMKCLVPHPQGERAVAKARELGLRVFILSNTSFLHARFIFSRELLATIPEIYALSYKIGVMKPNPEIWKWLLRQSGLEAGQCAYFDDVQSYIDTGLSLGFRAEIHDQARDSLVDQVESIVKR